MLKLAENLKLPIDVAGQAIALVGIRGSGKTNTAGVIVEELLDQGRQPLVIDPTDASWGLRSGYPVFIFGGPHGDLPLNETDGKVIAEFVVTERVPLILSVRHLRKAAQRRFVTELFEELYHLKGKPEHRTPLTVVIDEAPLFIPQKVMGEVARTVGAVEDLIARGRVSGFGVVLIGQRPATMNKDVLSQADTIITYRITSPHDRKALGDWIEENATIEERKQVLSSLATLKDGEAWIWAPMFNIFTRAQIRRRRTFDSSATPKAGEKIRTPKDLTSIDLDKLKGKLAATIEKAKADDPRELRKRIAELERQVKQVGSKLDSTGSQQPPPKVIEKPVITDRQIQQLESGLQRFGASLQRAGELMQKPVADMREKLAECTKALSSVRQPALPLAVPRMPAAAAAFGQRFERAARTEPRVMADGPGDPSIGNSGLRRMLIALAQRPSGLTRSQLGLRARVSPKGGSFDTYLSKARVNGWADTSGERVRITDAGLAALGPYEPLPAGEALLQHYIAEFGSSGAARMLRALADAYPRSLTRDDLSQASGVSAAGGSFDTYLSKLRTLELVVGGRGDLKASDELFEEA